MLMFWQFTVF